jgi:isopentenyl diphosphate isomerase/L-lactate dehydrogenase-like FMN-dependent dehydrogenase
MSNEWGKVVNLRDLERRARSILPKADFEYYQGGAEDEVTLHENALAFSRATLWPRVMVCSQAALHMGLASC